MIGMWREFLEVHAEMVEYIQHIFFETGILIFAANRIYELLSALRAERIQFQQSIATFFEFLYQIDSGTAGLVDEGIQFLLSFLGVQLGHLSPALTSAVIFAFVITALATPLLYGRAYDIHKWVQPLLEKVGFRAPPEIQLEQGRQYRLAMLGFHRDASSLLYNLTQSDPDLVRDTLVVDFNVALHPGIADTGATVKYGDLANPETLHHLGLNRCQVIVCTIPDDLLRGIDNRDLVHVVREMAPQASIIANAIAIDEVPQVYAAGADYVYLNRFEVAWTLQRAIQAGLEKQIDVFKNERQSRNHYRPDRKEILS